MEFDRDIRHLMHRLMASDGKRSSGRRSLVSASAERLNFVEREREREVRPPSVRASAERQVT